MTRRKADIPRVVPAYPEPYIRKKRKRGRPKKNGRPKLNVHQETRASPSKRTGSRFKAVSAPEDVYFMLSEMALFYKQSKSEVLRNLIRPAFKKAYQESLTLQRIAANKQKAQDEISDRDDVPRRTHF
jgi:predicted CopG family antitoxin